MMNSCSIISELLYLAVDRPEFDVILCHIHTLVLESSWKCHAVHRLLKQKPQKCRASAKRRFTARHFSLFSRFLSSEPSPNSGRKCWARSLCWHLVSDVFVFGVTFLRLPASVNLWRMRGLKRRAGRDLAAVGWEEKPGNKREPFVYAPTSHLVSLLNTSEFIRDSVTFALRHPWTR